MSRTNKEKDVNLKRYERLLAMTIQSILYKKIKSFDQLYNYIFKLKTFDDLEKHLVFCDVSLMFIIFIKEWRIK